MPTLEVLETLKQRINELGDEPRLLEERGESLGDITPTASPLDSDLEQLLNDENSGGGINEMEALLGSYVDDLGEAGEGEEGDTSFDDFSLDNLDLPGRFDYWEDAFSRCIKCYGCRDVCPMCFCKECALEDSDLVGTGNIPPEIPVFHLTRAIHMVGRCIDCGLCNEACPADIPLRTLYKKVADIIDDQFQYRPGYTKGKSPLNMLGVGTDV